MKRILIIFICLIALSVADFAQKKFIAGADFNSLIPVGSLTNRFQNTFTGSLYFGQQTSEKWTWVGRFEFFEFNDLNSDKLIKKINVTFNGKSTSYNVPLNKMKMNLTAVGLVAEGKYKVINLDKFSTNVNIGFGIYNWKFKRNAYVDSIFVDTSGSGSLMNVENLNVPKLIQIDWSGGFNFGLDLVYEFYQPIAFVFSANYKLLVAELWPTLSLDLENVSGLQMLDLRAGFRVKF